MLASRVHGGLMMSIENVAGIVVILAAYGLTWYLLLKSTKIVDRIAREGSKPARGANAAPGHGDMPGSDK